MRDLLTKKLHQIHEQILKMSVMVEEHVDKAITSLKDQNDDLAREIIEKDELVNQYERQIEELCVELTATQNPLATDLREIFTILKIVTDIERIGDHCVNIAKAILEMDTYVHPAIVDELMVMSKKVRKMIYDAINAYVDRDENLAITTAKRDDEVDDMYKKIYLELLDELKDNPKQQDQIVELLLVGRYLERIADHATNICERVVYMTSGKSVKF